MLFVGALKGTRTPDPLLRRQMLYPAELSAHKNGAGDGNRTHVASLEGWNSTIELHPHASMECWSGRRDSDSRPPPWQGGALPTELLPRDQPAADVVRAKGLEPIRRWAPEPKSGASANSATPAQSGCALAPRGVETRQPTQSIIPRAGEFVNTKNQELSNAAA